MTPGSDERNWALFAHLSGFAGFLVPLGNVIAPLVIWLLKKNDMPFVADQAREALNFQITVLIAAVISGLLTMILIGFVLLFLLGVYWLVMIIIATVRASEGKTFRYPFTLRLVK